MAARSPASGDQWITNKEIVEEGGALTVRLGVDEATSEDAFQRANITGLVITPEGKLHAFKVKFAV